MASEKKLFENFHDGRKTMDGRADAGACIYCKPSCVELKATKLFDEKSKTFPPSHLRAYRPRALLQVCYLADMPA